MSTIKDLEPNGVWRNFYSLTQIPRPSKKEAKVIAFMKQWGEEHGLETIVDDCGNVIMRKPATPGMENRKGVILQAHLDMVPQKNADKVHDFENDPIETHIENGWVKANGTTLGADDGLGAAAAMAVLEATDLQHGPIEALFTIDEETGMTGANKLQPGVLKGDILMNMDSETEGELYVGCAGGVDNIGTWTPTFEAVPAGMKRAEADPNEAITPLRPAYAVEVPTVTAVRDITAKTVASVEYVNTNGQVSNVPFEGINVVVTKYADGTKSVTKIVK